jgi:hypothetical protein
MSLFGMLYQEKSGNPETIIRLMRFLPQVNVRDSVWLQLFGFRIKPREAVTMKGQHS